MRDISGMKNFSIWHGMEAGFSFDKPGRFELKLRHYSEDTLIAELSPGDGYTYPRTRYLPVGKGPYHLVVHIPTCGDRPDEEPPVMLKLTSCVSGCSCICASSHATETAFQAESSKTGIATAWDVALVQIDALRHVA